MQSLIEFIINNSAYAPYLIFGVILLAGVNIPISIDVILVMSAFLAATTIPEYTIAIYLSVLFGCYFSAWIAYFIGRKFGVKLLKIRWFAKILSPHRLNRVKTFYEKHGFLTLLIGRFIPFGIRNCIFMTTGMSKMRFGKFIFRDAIACSIWASVCFYLFYTFGLNYQALLTKVKVVNLVIFLAFGVTGIGVIWYKKNKKNRLS
jgi:membrane-associated protein